MKYWVAKNLENNTVSVSNDKETSGTFFGERTVLESESTAQFNTIASAEPTDFKEDRVTLDRKRMNGYSDQTPAAILGRRRKLPDITLSDPLPGGSIGTEINLYNSVLAKLQADVPGLLSTFKGIRFDVRVNIQCRAAAGTYGQYLVGWKYQIDNAGQTTWHDRLSRNAYLCDIATAESLEFVIPYRHPYDYFPTIANAGNFSPAGYAFINIDNLMTKSIDGGTSMLELTAWFSLENVETGLFTGDNTVDLQSKLGTASVLSAVTQSAITLGTLGIAYATRPSVKVNNAGGSKESVQTKRETPTKSGASKGVRQAYWGDLSTVDDTDETPTLDMRSATPGMVDFCGMPGDYSIRDIGNMPGYLQDIRYTSADPVGTKHSMLIGAKPTQTINLSKGNASRSWGSYYSCYARYWRGEPKLVFSWATSPMIAARVLVEVQYLEQQHRNNVLTALVGHDMPSVTYLIKGSMTTSLAIPWHQRQPFRNTSEAIAIVTVTLLNPPVTYSVTPTFINCVITQSFDELQLCNTQHARGYEPAAPLQVLNKSQVDLQSNLREVHLEPAQERFEALPHYSLNSYMHEICSVYDLIRRWDDNLTVGTPAVADAITSVLLPYAFTKIEFDREANFVSATAPFAFITGTIEARNFYSSISRTAVSAILSNYTAPLENRVADGFSSTLIPDWPLLDYKVPYLATTPVVRRGFEASDPESVTDVKIISGTVPVVLDKALVRAGADFQMFFPNQIPPGAIWSQPYFPP